MKILSIILMLLMLTGCSAQPTWETVHDDWVDVAAVPAKKITIKLPKEAAAPTLQSEESGALYACDGYVLMLQTFQGGDMDATMRRLTGFSRDQLTCLQTQSGTTKRYTCVWSSVGEGGDHVGRAVILDDGSHHYAVSVMADFESAGELAETWQEILNSAELTDTD